MRWSDPGPVITIQKEGETRSGHAFSSLVQKPAAAMMAPFNSSAVRSALAILDS
jgi:hypothetical protein